MNKNIIDVFLTEDFVNIANKLINGELTEKELIQAFCDIIDYVDDKSYLEELVTKLSNSVHYAARHMKEDSYDEDDDYCMYDYDEE